MIARHEKQTLRPSRLAQLFLIIFPGTIFLSACIQSNLSNAFDPKSRNGAVTFQALASAQVSADGSGVASITLSNWAQDAYIKASNAEAGDQFGWPVAISDDTIVVGVYSEGNGSTAHRQCYHH